MATVKTVKMHGPSVSDPKTMVNREVPEGDVEAYERAGFKLGHKPDLPDAEDVSASNDSALQEAETDIHKMTKAELITEANSRGVEVSDSMTKAEIIEAIEAK